MPRKKNNGLPWRPDIVQMRQNLFNDNPPDALKKFAEEGLSIKTLQTHKISIKMLKKKVNELPKDCFAYEFFELKLREFKANNSSRKKRSEEVKTLFLQNPQAAVKQFAEEGLSIKSLRTYGVSINDLMKEVNKLPHDCPAYIFFQESYKSYTGNKQGARDTYRSLFFNNPKAFLEEKAQEKRTIATLFRNGIKPIELTEALDKLNPDSIAYKFYIKEIENYNVYNRKRSEIRRKEKNDSLLPLPNTSTIKDGSSSDASSDREYDAFKKSLSTLEPNEHPEYDAETEVEEDGEELSNKLSKEETKTLNKWLEKQLEIAKEWKKSQETLTEDDIPPLPWTFLDESSTPSVLQGNSVEYDESSTPSIIEKQPLNLSQDRVTEEHRLTEKEHPTFQAMQMQ